MQLSLSSTSAAVVVELSDSGPGIPAQDLSRIFERFERVEGTNVPGTGIGLSLVKELVEAHEREGLGLQRRRSRRHLPRRAPRARLGTHRGDLSPRP